MTLEEVKNNAEGHWNYDSVSIAADLLFAFVLKFIISLFITRNIVDYAEAPTKKLVGAETDIVKGYQEIDLLKSTVMGINKYHRNWFEEATKLASLVDPSPTIPRICERQTMRDKQPTNDPETYYRITVTSQLVDHLINQLSLRFDTSQLSIVKGLTIIPTLMQERTIKQGRASWNTDFMEFAEKYHEDFPEFKSFKSELDIWEVYWLQKFGG